MDDVSQECTNDSLFNGRLICRQHKNGYRFSIDAVLVAHYARINAGDAVLDLGAGCGIIPLILYFRYGDAIKITGIELQSQLALLAKSNIGKNCAGDQINIIADDIRAISLYVAAESFASVVCNPPFYTPAAGRLSSASEAATARHQLHGDIGLFLRAAAFAVKNKGLVTFVYPAKALTELFHAAKVNRLQPCRMRPVYSYPDEDNATLVLVEFRKNGGKQLQLEKPLYIYNEKNGDFSLELQAMYEP